VPIRRLVVTNRGGETHTFTQTTRFGGGGGIVPPRCREAGRASPLAAGVRVVEPRSRYHRSVAEPHDKPLSEQLEEIGSRLAWVRDYL
jgi:hypothetical protein